MNKSIHSREIKNATLFQWKIHGLRFKELDRDNVLSCFQETLMNSTKHF